MSVSDLIEKLASTQAALIKALQEEYFCDDVVPPQSAFGWDAEALRAYFESGGETLPANGSGGNGAAAKPAAAAAPPPPRELGPPDTVASGRPIFLALGDSLTEFGQHVCDPTWDKKAPFAKSELQRRRTPKMIHTFSCVGLVRRAAAAGYGRAMDVSWTCPVGALRDGRAAAAGDGHRDPGARPRLADAAAARLLVAPARLPRLEL